MNSYPPLRSVAPLQDKAGKGLGAIATEFGDFLPSHRSPPALQEGFPGNLSQEAQTEPLLHSSTRRASEASAQQNFVYSTFQTSSQEQIMQREPIHQGLERVFMMYGRLTRIARRIAGSLAITQKAR